MRIPKITATTLLILLLAAVWAPSASAAVSFSFFYSNLTPYGSWTVSTSYGRVWRPSVYTVGWNPYYDGHWVYTDLGWTWVSDYPWGDVCYHYGTWDFDPAVGWVWVPGYVWAPAWVEFRTGPDYIGWAPVPPRFSIGASFGVGAIDQSRFVFVSAGNFLAPTIRFHTVPLAQTRLVFTHTSSVRSLSVENGIVVNRGLDAREVERISGRHVRMTPIDHVARVVPGAHFSRSEVRVDPQRLNRGFRVTEPAPAGKAEPPAQGRQHHEGDKHPNGHSDGRVAPDSARYKDPRNEARSGHPAPVETSSHPRSERFPAAGHQEPSRHLASQAPRHSPPSPPAAPARAHGQEIYRGSGSHPNHAGSVTQQRPHSSPQSGQNGHPTPKKTPHKNE